MRGYVIAQNSSPTGQRSLSCVTPPPKFQVEGKEETSGLIKADHRGHTLAPGRPCALAIVTHMTSSLIGALFAGLIVRGHRTPPCTPFDVATELVPPDVIFSDGDLVPGTLIPRWRLGS